VKTVEFDIGNTVICDICDKDYTHSNACGGFLFQSKGVCPECAPRFLASVKRYGEESFIRSYAADDEPFRDFILGERGGNNKVTISGGDAAEVDRMAADYKNHLGIEK
jgi:hypothetical protein